MLGNRGGDHTGHELALDNQKRDKRSKVKEGGRMGDKWKTHFHIKKGVHRKKKKCVGGGSEGTPTSKKVITGGASLRTNHNVSKWDGITTSRRRHHEIRKSSTTWSYLERIKHGSKNKS